MLPSKFIILESLPQNSNGKVDRQELPTPELDRPKLGARFSAPTTPMESVLAKIWSEALSINSVGNHDSFFDLGGDSIIAMKVISAIGRIFPWNLTWRSLTRCTLRGGSLWCQRHLRGAGGKDRALCFEIDDFLPPKLKPFSR